MDTFMDAGGVRRVEEYWLFLSLCESWVHTDGIRPDEVNWITAGRGIAYSERTAPELRMEGGRIFLAYSPQNGERRI